MFADDMTQDMHEPAKSTTVHIVPKGRGWHVVRPESREEEAATFSDLGEALDEATSGPILVHVVVHPRDAACDAA